jgi:parallel beta-helix repeat protein
VASGKTLTVNGSFDAGVYQCFSGSGAVSGLKEARPEWFYSGSGSYNTAINTALAASYNVVLEGTYTLKTASPYTWAIRVTRAGTTIKGYNATLIVDATSAIGPQMISVAADNCTITGITFNSRQIAETIGVFAPDTSGITVTNNRFIDPMTGAFGTSGGTTFASFTDNAITGTGYGVLLDTYAGVSNSDIVIANNTFKGSGHGDGIEINSPAAPAYRLTIQNNVISGYNATLDVAGLGIGLARVKDSIVSGNTIFDCDGSGIHVEDLSENIVIANNSVSSTGRPGIDIQAMSTALPKNIQISGNTITNCGLAPAFALGSAAIEVGKYEIVAATATGQPGAPIVGVQILNNIVTGNAVKGIYVTGENMVISGNLVANNVGYGIELLSVTKSIISDK